MKERDSNHSQRMGDQAAEWLVRLDAEPVTEETDSAFKAWLDSDPAHEASLEQCEAVLVLAEKLKNDPDVRWAFEEARELATRGPKSATRGGRPATGFMGWLGQTMPGLDNVLVMARDVRALAAASVILLTVGTALILTRTALQEYETAIGEQRLIALEDGSTITLNTDSFASVDYRADRRRIHLARGEAFFTVTTDADRPFEVWAGNGLARAVGTSYSVMLEADRVMVSVLEGVVAVSPTRSETVGTGEISDLPQVKAGEAMTYSVSGVIGSIEEGDIGRINAWRAGRLEFRDVPLVDAVAEYNRYTTRKIIIGSQNIEDLAVTGVLDIGDTESFLFLSEESLGVKPVEMPNTIVLL